MKDIADHVPRDAFPIIWNDPYHTGRMLQLKIELFIQYNSRDELEWHICQNEYNHGNDIGVQRVKQAGFTNQIVYSMNQRWQTDESTSGFCWSIITFDTMSSAQNR